jgi:hypothetical protein
MLFALTAFSQKNFEANFGAGFMEGLSLKMKYGNNIQLGICQGFAPGISPLWLTGAELYYHFGKKSKYTEQRCFYIMTGVSATLFAKGYDPTEKVLLYPRIGRSMNFSKNKGLNVDMGPGFLSTDDNLGYYTLTAGIHYFIRY